MVAERKIKYKIKSFLYRRPNALPLFHYLFGNEWKCYCNKGTDICIEGYPSTGNTFVYNIFNRVYPGKRISHHTHSIANLKRAVKYDVPTIILCRRPKEAVASRCVRFNIGLREALLQYVEFYTYVTKLKNKLLVSDFDSSTKRIDELVERFERYSGMDKEANTKISRLKDEAYDHINKWSSRNNKSKSIPDEDREEKKKSIKRSILKKEEYKKCREIYSRVVSGTEA